MIEIGNVTFNKELIDKLLKQNKESWVAEDFIFKEVKND